MKTTMEIIEVVNNLNNMEVFQTLNNLILNDEKEIELSEVLNKYSDDIIIKAVLKKIISLFEMDIQIENQLFDHLLFLEKEGNSIFKEFYSYREDEIDIYPSYSFNLDIINLVNIMSKFEIALKGKKGRETIITSSQEIFVVNNFDELLKLVKNDELNLDINESDREEYPLSEFPCIYVSDQIYHEVVLLGDIIETEGIQRDCYYYDYQNFINEFLNNYDFTFNYEKIKFLFECHANNITK